MLYIVIGETYYDLSTNELRNEAKQALRDAGLKSAKVWSGAPDDGNNEAVETSEVLFAD